MYVPNKYEILTYIGGPIALALIMIAVVLAAGAFA